jgi:hypothetical protein
LNPTSSVSASTVHLRAAVAPENVKRSCLIGFGCQLRTAVPKFPAPVQWM